MKKSSNFTCQSTLDEYAGLTFQYLWEIRANFLGLEAYGPGIPRSLSSRSRDPLFDPELAECPRYSPLGSPKSAEGR
jgi:hypothetical protein